MKAFTLALFLGLTRDYYTPGFRVFALIAFITLLIFE